MTLINFEVNLTSTWSSTCVINNSRDAAKFAIPGIKLYQLKIIQNYYNKQNLALKKS